MFAFLKMGLGFVVGALAGAYLGWAGIGIFCARHPLSTSRLGSTTQIGDIGTIILSLLGALAVIGFLAALGGVGGVVVVRRFF